MRHSVCLSLGLAGLLLFGCSLDFARAPAAEPAHEVRGRDVAACGRIRFIANGEEVAWGPIFDRPTPELYHVETQRFINRIELAGGGWFAEAIERDGGFCWQLPPGKYFISRIFPFQDDLPASQDDPAKWIFPGVAFQIDRTGRSSYLGTLRIAVSVQRDFMANRRMTGRPSIEVLDELDRDPGIAEKRRTADLEKNLMVSVPGLEGLPFHQNADIPAISRVLPPLLFTLPH